MSAGGNLTMNEITFQQATNYHGPDVRQWCEAFNAAFAEFGITHRIDKAMIIGLGAAETNNFKQLSETFNYHAGALRRVFGSRFSHYQAAMLGFQMGEKEIPANRQEAIANLAYGGRMGNGSREGWKYRARGVIPIRGKKAYREASSLVGVELLEHPDELQRPELATRVACALYVARGCVGVGAIDVIEKALHLDDLPDDEKGIRLACYRRARAGLA